MDTSICPPMAPVPAVVRVQSTIQDWIRSGQIAPGDRLPTEQAISDQTRVSRTTVRAAFRALRRRGHIAPVPDGRGWVVRGGDEAPEGEPLPETPPAASPEETGMPLIVGVLSHDELPNDAPQSPGWMIYELLGVVRGLADHRRAAVVRIPKDDRERFDEGVEARAWLATTEIMQNPAIRERLLALHGSGTPVTVHYDADDALPFDRVVSDQAVGMAKLTAWLFARGCRRILTYWPWIPGSTGKGGGEPRWLAQRRRGFLEAHQRAGVPVPPMPEAYNAHFPGPVSRESLACNTDMAYGFLARAFAADPDWDAVACVSDGQVAAMTEALRRFPQPQCARMPVAGFDNYWQRCPELIWTGHKPAATVDKRNAVVGHTLVEVMEERLANLDRPDPIIRHVEPELCVIEA